MNYKTSKEKRRKAKLIVAHYFSNHQTNQPFLITDGQADIFSAMLDPTIPRLQIECTTQYGKSQVTAFAICFLSAILGNKVIVLAPSKKQSQIIMDYVLSHIFDHSVFQSGLDDLAGLEKLNTRKSRSHLSWLGGGELKSLTVDASSSVKEGKAVMGEGGDVIISDESALIPDSVYSKITRMLGGNVQTSRLIKIGNPFLSKHFQTTSKSYTKIHIDYKQSIKEGRLTNEFVKEQKASMTKADFDVFYNVKPPTGLGFDSIFSSKALKASMSSIKQLEDPVRVAGLDVSGSGSDESVYSVSLISNNQIKLLSQERIRHDGDIKILSDIVNERLLGDAAISSIGVDVVGIGKGVADNLFNIESREYEVHYYIAGSKATNLLYFNHKSELLFELQQMCLNENVDLSAGSKQLFEDLKGFTRRRMSDRKIKNEDPTDSPDFADSLLASISAGGSYSSNNIEFF